MKILIIDDDPLVQKALFMGLIREKHEVYTSNDAYNALTQINAGSFDLIISDIMMPVISGIEMLSILRQIELNKTPLIIMTSLSDPYLSEIASKLGVTDYLQKPIDFNILKTKISSIESHFIH